METEIIRRIGGDGGASDGVSEPASGAGNDGQRLESDNGSDDNASSENGRGTIDDPIKFNGGTDDATSRKRKRGNGKPDGITEATTRRRSETKQTKSLDLNAGGRRTLAAQVVGVHKIIGIMLKCPDTWTMSETEGEELTSAVLDVCAQYKIKPNPKAVAWANLLAVAGAVYGTRLTATALIIKARQARERAESPIRQPVANPAAKVGPRSTPESGGKYVFG